ncbi:MAG: DUF7533 family protein [Halococcoides sp.]
MAQGILATIGRATALVLIAPVIFLALDALLRGEWLTSAVFWAVAGLMFALGEYVTRPSDLPETAAERVVSAIVRKE